MMKQKICLEILKTNLVFIIFILFFWGESAFTQGNSIGQIEAEIGEYRIASGFTPPSLGALKADREREKVSLEKGIGFVYQDFRNRYFIITCEHVITGVGTGSIWITLNNKKIPLQVYSADTQNDIAVLILKNNSDKQYLEPLPFSHRGIRNNEVVKTYGYSEMKEGKIKSISVNRPDYRGCCGYLQTDVGLEKRDSGGPLLDQSGNVIGINASLSEKRESFHVNIKKVKNLLPFEVEEIDNRGEIKRARRAFLGAVWRSRQRSGSPVFLHDVILDSEAYKASLPLNARLVSFMGIPNPDLTVVMEEMEKIDPWEKVSFTIKIANEPQKVSLGTGKMSDSVLEKIATNFYQKEMRANLANKEFPFGAMFPKSRENTYYLVDDLKTLGVLIRLSMFSDAILNIIDPKKSGEDRTKILFPEKIGYLLYY